ncbi:MAG: hypothetical protein V4615_01870 [Bacteroidota bacterium]
MKKILAAISALVILGSSSCAKCTKCTKENDPDVKLCEKDYGSNTAYGLAIDIYEAQNYTCKKSL